MEIWERIPDPDAIAGTDLLGLQERAARAAANSGEIARAAAIVQRALKTPSADLSRSDRIRLFDRLYWYAYESSDLDGADAAARGALALVSEAGPVPERAITLANLGHLETSVGRHGEAVRIGEEAVAEARVSGDLRAEARGCIVIAQALCCLGRTDPADEMARAAVDRFEAIGDLDGKAYAIAWWGTNAEFDGRYGDAVEIGRDGLAAARRDGTEGRYGDTFVAIINESLIDLGRWDEAHVALRSALARASDGPAAIWLGTNLARLLIYRGALDEARAHLERGARIAAAGPDRVWQLEDMVLFLFADGRADEARQLADDIITACPEPERDLTLWWLLVQCLKGEVRRLETERARRDGTVADSTLAVARGRLDLLRRSGQAARRDGGTGTLLDAYLAWADAEETRMDGRSDPDAWAEAARCRDLVAQPHDRAIALLRGAEALLQSNAGRDDASQRLRAAWSIADGLRAMPLLTEIDALARRGRLDLGLATTGQSVSDDPAAAYGLTEREREVLALVADGRTNRHIGEALFITEKTASVHVTHILTKMGVTSRTEAALLAARAGIVSAQEPGGEPGEA